MVSWKDKLYIVIAAHNEEGSLGKVLSSLKRNGYSNIIVVDDGSVDKTYYVAEKYGVFVLKHFFNMGQGAALQTGIDYALSLGAEFIVTFDADGQHRVADIPSLVKPVYYGEVDVTFGSRFLGKNNNIPFIRRIVLKCAVFVIWFFYGVKMTDAHNGLRCFSSKAARLVRIKSNRMEHASEIVEQVTKKNLNYKEIPVVVNYNNIRRGQGGVFGAFKILLKMIWRRFL